MTADQLAATESKMKETFDLVMRRLDTIQTSTQMKQRTVTDFDGKAVVELLIKEALAIYDADKTGMPDFALEPAGGTIVNIRCSETFDPRNIQYRIFGVPVWSTSNSPRTVIQPSMYPGECWAFKGFEGHLVIRLTQRIVPSSFSYEHIAKEVSPEGHITSAPAKFKVTGLKDENDRDGDVLGNFEYLDNGQPLQNFAVQDPTPKAYEFIELTVLSNHGHFDYTCLYRFRVHGTRALNG
jgi:SUN domain-containing protein 1/2